MRTISRCSRQNKKGIVVKVVIKKRELPEADEWLKRRYTKITSSKDFEKLKKKLFGRR